MHFRFATKLLNWHSVAECLWRRRSLVAQLVCSILSQFIPPQPIWRSSVMLSSHQPWRSLFPSGLPTEIIYLYHFSSASATCFVHFFLFCLTIFMLICVYVIKNHVSALAPVSVHFTTKNVNSINILQWRTQEFCSGGGGAQKIHLSTEDSENGDLGTLPP